MFTFYAYSTFISHKIFFKYNLTQYVRKMGQRQEGAKTIAARCRAIRFTSLGLINIVAFPRECAAARVGIKKHSRKRLIF